MRWKPNDVHTRECLNKYGLSRIVREFCESGKTRNVIKEIRDSYIEKLVRAKFDGNEASTVAKQIEEMNLSDWITCFEDNVLQEFANSLSEDIKCLGQYYKVRGVTNAVKVAFKQGAAMSDLKGKADEMGKVFIAGLV